MTKHRRVWQALLLLVAIPISLALGNLPSLAGNAKGSASTPDLTLANSLLAQGKEKEALKAFQEANKHARGACAPCYLGMSMAYRKLGDYKHSEESAEKALKLTAGDKTAKAAAYILHGEALVAMADKPTDKKLKQAEGDFRAALALAPGWTVSRFNLGFVLLKQGRDPEGIRELKNYLAEVKNEKEAKEAQRLIADPRRAREPFAPDFSFTTLDGHQISLKRLTGKVALLDFWGTWCGPCREAVPAMVDLNKKFSGQPFVLAGISSDANEEAWKSFVAKNKMDWPEYIDLSKNMQRLFEIRGFPTYIVLNREGIIRYRKSGYDLATFSELEDAIKKALKEPHPVKNTGTSSSSEGPSY